MTDETPKLRTKPPHSPTPEQRKQVEAMVAYGIPQEDISEVIGISSKTLRLHYRKELDTGTAKANAKVAESLYKKATGDGSQSVTAAIFWLKTRGKWKETVFVEGEVKVDNPTAIPCPKTYEEWLRYVATTGRATNGSDPDGPVH